MKPAEQIVEQLEQQLRDGLSEFEAALRAIDESSKVSIETLMLEFTV